MKRTIISLLVLVGVGGLIGLLSYHPKTPAVATETSSSSSHSPSGAVAGSSASPSSTAGGYKDGSYTGTTVDVGYGPVQVQAVVSGGKLATVKFLQMPYDRQQSAEIASQAEPILMQEALQAQSANIDTVSGATSDSEGFAQSLQSALGQAKA